jgi:hypothetical protein
LSVDASVRHLVSPAAVLSVAIAIGGWAPHSVLARQSTSSQAQIYATVVDAAKAPVTGLGTADFVLRDGATRLGVLNAVPATDPLSVAIVIDGFDAVDLPALRRAIDELVRTTTAAVPGSAVGLVAVDHGSDRVMMLKPGAPGLDAAVSEADGGLSTLGQRIGAACYSLQEAPPDRRTVLALIRRRPGDVDSSWRSRLTAAILRSRAALWTVEVAPASPASPRSPALDEALTEGARLSGALRETVGGVADVPAASARTVARWLSQYLVTYTWPEPMVSVFALTTRHDAGEVLTPAWMR